MVQKIKSLLLKYKRVIIFAIIGGINTAVDFLIFTALSGFTPIKVEYCQAGGYIAGIVCSYILNQAITFKDAEKGHTLYKVARYIIVNAISLAFSMYGIKILVAMQMNRYIAKIIITVVTMVINYIGYKLFVFRVKER